MLDARFLRNLEMEMKFLQGFQEGSLPWFNIQVENTWMRICARNRKDRGPLGKHLCCTSLFAKGFRN